MARIAGLLKFAKPSKIVGVQPDSIVKDEQRVLCEEIKHEKCDLSKDMERLQVELENSKKRLRKLLLERCDYVDYVCRTVILESRAFMGNENVIYAVGLCGEAKKYIMDSDIKTGDEFLECAKLFAQPCFDIYKIVVYAYSRPKIEIFLVNHLCHKELEEALDYYDKTHTE